MDDWFIQLYTKDELPFYVNGVSGEASWLLPENFGVDSIKHVTHLTDDGTPYYENVQTKQTAWQLPKEAMSPAARKSSVAVALMNLKQAESYIGSRYDEDAALELEEELEKHREQLVEAAPKVDKTKTLKRGLSSFFMSAKSQIGFDEEETSEGSEDSEESDESEESVKPKKTQAASSSEKTAAVFTVDKKLPISKFFFNKYGNAKDDLIIGSQIQLLCYEVIGTFMTIDEVNLSLNPLVDKAKQAKKKRKQYDIDYEIFTKWWEKHPKLSTLDVNDAIMIRVQRCAQAYKR